MCEVDLSNIKKRYIGIVICLITAIIFFAIICYYFLFPNVKKFVYTGEVKASSYVIKEFKNRNNDTKYSVTYSYIVNNNEYKCKSNLQANTANYMNQKNTIYYDKNNPSRCVSEYDTAFNMDTYTLFFIFGAFLFLTIYPYFNTKKNIKRIKELECNGKLIKGLSYELVREPFYSRIDYIRLYCIRVEYEFKTRFFYTFG